MIYLMMIDGEEEKRKFVILYEKYRCLMLKVACNILQDNFLAEDAVHDAFMKIAGNMKKIGEVDTLETKRYLITVTKNATIDIYRKKKRQINREISVDELGESSIPLSYMETEVDEGILEILKDLPVKYRDVFLLKYANEMGNDEIAKLLKLSEGTVRQRLSRGKSMIQEAMNKREKEHGTYGSNR